jgi:hypothetical protein
MLEQRFESLMYSATLLQDDKASSRLVNNREQAGF